MATQTCHFSPPAKTPLLLVFYAVSVWAWGHEGTQLSTSWASPRSSSWGAEKALPQPRLWAAHLGLSVHRTVPPEGLMCPEAATSHHSPPIWKHGEGKSLTRVHLCLSHLDLIPSPVRAAMGQMAAFNARQGPTLGKSGPCLGPRGLPPPPALRQQTLTRVTEQAGRDVGTSPAKPPRAPKADSPSCRHQGE